VAGLPKHVMTEFEENYDTPFIHSSYNQSPYSSLQRSTVWLLQLQFLTFLAFGQGKIDLTARAARPALKIALLLLLLVIL
jgi:hypothetical protein